MSKLKVKIFTLFPDLFPGILSTSIIGDALRNQIWSLEIIDIRQFGIDARKTVDDTVYGGGSGMLMRADVLGAAIDANITNSAKIIYPSPRGALLNQNKVRDLSKVTELAIVCGRYEGIDQRAIDEYQMEEISIGDYVLSNGELAAMVMLDAIIRNLPGVLGANDSLKEESFGDGQGSPFDNLLEYPQFTKPPIWRERRVPEVLLSGHHQNIAKWRLEQAISVTKNRNNK